MHSVVDPKSVLAALLVAAALVGGCDERPHRLSLTDVPPPPGGEILAATTIDDRGSRRLVALAETGLFVHPTDPEGQWRREPVDWPESDRHPEDPLANVVPSEGSYNFTTDQRFAARDGRLWLLTRTSRSGSPVLLTSDDAGDDWTRVPLPETYREAGGGEGSTGTSGPISRAGPTTFLRLVTGPRAELHLVDGRRVWRARSEGDTPVDGWESVDLDGIDLHATAGDQSLPGTLRHYLPSTEDRPFELLTVLRDRLFVYRRGQTDRWVLVSTLPALDRRLTAAVDASTVFLISPSGLYRAGSRAEEWQRIATSRHSEVGALHSFLGLSGESADSAEILFVGTDRGAIRRSDDGGRSWKTVRPADPDGRAITGFAGRAPWAASAGEGMLRSDDRGRSWSRHRTNPRATRPYDIDIGPNGQLLASTISGLFRLTGAPEEGHWDRIHERATASIDVAPTASDVYSGTFGGQIVTKTGQGELVTSDAELAEAGGSVLFHLSTALGRRWPPETVTAIRRRPDTEDIFAWTKDRGLLVSSDRGRSWERRALTDAMVAALSDSTAVDLAAGPGEQLYLLTRLQETSGRVRVWRSPDDGRTWRAISTFRSSAPTPPLRLFVRPSGNGESILLCGGDGLRYSPDGGTTWQTLEGPWQEGIVRAFDTQPSRDTVVFDLQHATKIGLLADGATGDAAIRSYTLDRPGRADLRRSEVRFVERFEDFVYVATADGIATGTPPEEETRLEHAPTIAATLLAVLGITLFGFWFTWA